MFGLFKKKVPLDGSRRAEIELRLRRVIESLGSTSARQFEMVSSFDSLYDGQVKDPDDLKAVLGKVAQHMKLDPSGIGFRISDLRELEVMSLYEPTERIITIDQIALSDPALLIPVIAHRLGHSALDDQMSSVQWAPQFMACVRGFAVPISNTLPNDVVSKSQDPASWEANRLGLLTTADYGYVCALLARARGEEEPSWAQLLRTDAAVTYRSAVRTFPSRDELILDSPRIPTVTSTVSEMREHLSSKDSTIQYAAIMTMLGLESPDTSLVLPICECLKQRDELLVVRALCLLAKLGKDASDAVPYVEGLISSSVDDIACKAAEALVAIAPSELSFSIAGAVLEDRWSISTELANTLSKYGHDASEIAPNVCRRLVIAAKKAMDSDVEAMAACLGEIHPSPQEAIEIAITNDETRDWISRYLAELDADSTA